MFPTLREQINLNEVYALCEVVYPKNGHGSNADVTDFMVFNAVKNAILVTHGDLGFASLKSSIKVSYGNKDTNIFILRGSRNHFHILTSSIVFIQKIDDHDAFLRTLYIGGSIRCCQKFIVKYHKRNLPLLYPACTTNEQREAIMKSVMDACGCLDPKKTLEAEEEELEPSHLEKIVNR